MFSAVPLRVWLRLALMLSTSDWTWARMAAEVALRAVLLPWVANFWPRTAAALTVPFTTARTPAGERGRATKRGSCEGRSEGSAVDEQWVGVGDSPVVGKLPLRHTGAEPSWQMVLLPRRHWPAREGAGRAWRAGGRRAELMTRNGGVRERPELITRGDLLLRTRQLMLFGPTLTVALQRAGVGSVWSPTVDTHTWAGWQPPAAQVALPRAGLRGEHAATAAAMAAEVALALAAAWAAWAAGPPPRGGWNCWFRFWTALPIVTFRQFLNRTSC